MSNITIKKGRYLEKNTGKVICVDSISCGQNEILGLCNGTVVITDYATTEQYKYLGLNKLDNK